MCDFLHAILPADPHLLLHITNVSHYILQSVLEGYNATIMAYGQTGSGKSFTMQEDPDHIGLIPRAIVHVFEGKESDEDRDTEYHIHVSYVEIYNEEIRDLLSDTPEKKLEIKNNNVQGMFFSSKNWLNSFLVFNLA
jgi:hypothetical protein